MTQINLSLVSKITVATLGAQPKPNTVETETKVAVIYGRCTAQKTEQSNFGEYVKFVGEFEGVNVSTGGVFRSGVLIVPKILEELLSQAITIDEANAVDFAVEVWVAPSEKGNTGYTYGIKPLIKPAESDALAALRNLAAPSIAKIEAPETVLDLDEKTKAKK